MKFRRIAASLSCSPWGEEALAMESLPGYGDRFERSHYGYNAKQSSPEGGLRYLRVRWITECYAKRRCAARFCAPRWG